VSGLAAAGLLADDIRHTIRRYGGLSMTAKQIPDAAAIVYCRQVCRQLLKKAAKTCWNNRSIGVRTIGVSYKGWRRPSLSNQSD